MKKVINAILIILLTIALLGFGLLTISRTMLNTGISNTKRSEHNKGIGATYNIKGEDKLVTYAEIYNVDKIDLNVVHFYLDKDLTKQKIPTDTVEYVFAEDDYEGMYYDYRTTAIGYLLDKNEKPVLEIDRILGMTERGLTKYNAEKGTKLPVNDIRDDVETVAVGIDTQLEKLKSNKLLTTGLKLATSNKLYYGSIIIGIIALVALLIINGLLSGLKQVGVSFVIAGVIDVIVSIVANSDLLGKLKEVGAIMLNYFSHTSLTYGIVYLVIGILLIVIPTVIGNNKKAVKEESTNEKVKETVKETVEEVVEEPKEEKKETPKKKTNNKNKKGSK